MPAARRSQHNGGVQLPKDKSAGGLALPANHETEPIPTVCKKPARTRKRKAAAATSGEVAPVEDQLAQAALAASAEHVQHANKSILHQKERLGDQGKSTTLSKV